MIGTHDDNGWECIAYNPASGVSTWWKFEDDGVLMQSRQDVSTLLDENKAMANVADRHWQGDYHRVARLPAAMAFEKDSLINGALQAGDEKVISRILNDSDNRYLRTKEGNI